MLGVRGLDGLELHLTPFGGFGYLHGLLSKERAKRGFVADPQVDESFD